MKYQKIRDLTPATQEKIRVVLEETFGPVGPIDDWTNIQVGNLLLPFGDDGPHAILVALLLTDNGIDPAVLYKPDLTVIDGGKPT